MIEKPNEERATSEAEIRLFLRLFPLLAAHFEIKGEVAGLIGLFRNPALVLAERYEQAAIEEKQGDKGFVEGLPSILANPEIKRPIVEDESD